MSRLSVVIITKNEAANLPRCLGSVAWADEIVVVDSGSEDDTVKIAVDHGARVVQHTWRGYGPGKRAGVEAAAGPWILSIDADEEVTPMLATEIQAAVAASGEAVGYYMPRLTRFLGRWIRHCGWYPDYVLRLFRKGSGDFDDATIHEKVEVKGPTGNLSCDLLHHCYPNLESYLEKSNRYTTIGAQEAALRGRRAGWFDLTVRPLVSFVSHYLVRQGFRDGREGLMVSALSAKAVFVKYAKLYHLQRRTSENTEVRHDRAKID